MKSRLLAVPLALAIAGLATFAPRPMAVEAQGTNCEFMLGFKSLHDMIPEVVGDCIENEWHNADNGDGLQRTTRGLMVWRKADNWTAFTNGHMTWINGPLGLQARLNTERFAWEGTLPPPSLPTANTGGATGGSAGGGTTDGGTADKPAAPTNQAPTLDIYVSDDRPRAGESFTVRLLAEDDSGVDAMWWWASETRDGQLKNTHAFDCGGATPCRTTWEVSTTDTGEITIHARTRDVDGRLSDEVTEEIRVRTAPTPAQ